MSARPIFAIATRVKKPSALGQMLNLMPRMRVTRPHQGSAPSGTIPLLAAITGATRTGNGAAAENFHERKSLPRKGLGRLARPGLT